jgi:predicted nucleotidyltransferase
MKIESMQQREQKILRECIRIIREYVDPGKIILFGSRAKSRGGFEKKSDFDLAVDSKDKVNFRTERKLKEAIERVSGLYKVDIVFLGTVDERFKNIILETGKIVYERES